MFEVSSMDLIGVGFEFGIDSVALREQFEREPGIKTTASRSTYGTVQTITQTCVRNGVKIMLLIVISLLFRKLDIYHQSSFFKKCSGLWVVSKSVWT